MRREADRVKAHDPELSSYALECRGMICRFAVADGDPGRFWLDLYDDAWFRTRYNSYDIATNAFFVSLTDKPRIDGRVIVSHLLEQIQRGRALTVCARQHREAGRLKLAIMLTGTPPAQRGPPDGEAVVVRLSGELSDTGVGGCVRTAVERLVVETKLPDDRAGAVASGWLTFDANGDVRWQDEE